FFSLTQQVHACGLVLDVGREGGDLYLEAATSSTPDRGAVRVPLCEAGVFSRARPHLAVDGRHQLPMRLLQGAFERLTEALGLFEPFTGFFEQLRTLLEAHAAQ